MRYISDLHIGKVNPKRLDYGFDVDVRKYDLPEFLKANVVSAPDVSAVLAQIEPPYPGYQRTIVALQTYMQLAKQDDGEQLPAVTKAILPGDSYAGVPNLFACFAYMAICRRRHPARRPHALPRPFVDGVKNYQRRYGRTVDGRITAQTVSDLNVLVSSRVREMQLTLERWRWLPT